MKVYEAKDITCYGTLVHKKFGFEHKLHGHYETLSFTDAFRIKQLTIYDRGTKREIADRS